MNRRRCWMAVPALGWMLTLAGCSTVVSPYGGESSFNCAAQFEDGVPCQSVTGTAVNYKAGVLPWQNRDKTKLAGGDRSIAEMQETALLPPVSPSTAPPVHGGPARETISPRQQGAPASGMPLRVPERILRIWVAPFEDDEGSLNDQKFIYVSVTRGQWQMEANRVGSKEQYRQIYPLGRSSNSDSERPDPKANARAEARSTVINSSNLVVGDDSTGYSGRAGSSTEAD